MIHSKINGYLTLEGCLTLLQLAGIKIEGDHSLLEEMLHVDVLWSFSNDNSLWPQKLSKKSKYDNND